MREPAMERGGRLDAGLRKMERRDCESEFCDESLGIRVEAGLREVEGGFGRCEFGELGEVAGVRVRESSEL